MTTKLDPTEKNTTYLRSMDKIDRIAATFLWMEDLAVQDETIEVDGKEVEITDFSSYEEAIKWWSNVTESIGKDPLWSDGKHSGDCTKQPWTCFRCVVEEYRSYAAQWLTWFEKGDSLWTMIQ